MDSWLHAFWVPFLSNSDSRLGAGGDAGEGGEDVHREAASDVKHEVRVLKSNPVEEFNLDATLIESRLTLFKSEWGQTPQELRRGMTPRPDKRIASCRMPTKATARWSSSRRRYGPFVCARGHARVQERLRIVSVNHVRVLQCGSLHDALMAAKREVAELKHRVRPCRLPPYSAMLQCPNQLDH